VGQMDVQMPYLKSYLALQRVRPELVEMVERYVVGGWVNKMIVWGL